MNKNLLKKTKYKIKLRSIIKDQTFIDYHAKLKQAEQNFLKRFFNEEYNNQRESFDDSIYNNSDFFRAFKLTDEYQTEFKTKFAKYKSVNKKATEEQFFVIYKQREAGRQFGRIARDLNHSFIYVEQYVNETELSYDQFKEDRQAFFLDCVKNKQLYLFVKENLIEILDEQENKAKIELINNINNTYNFILNNKHLSNTDLYSYLYKMFLFIKFKYKHENIEIVDNVFNELIFKKEKYKKVIANS